MRCAAKLTVQAQVAEVVEYTGESDPCVQASCDRRKSRGHMHKAMSSLIKRRRTQMQVGRNLGAEKHFCIVRYCHGPSPACLSLCDISTFSEAIQPFIRLCSVALFRISNSFYFCKALRCLIGLVAVGVSIFLQDLLRYQKMPTVTAQ